MFPRSSSCDTVRSGSASHGGWLSLFPPASPVPGVWKLHVAPHRGEPVFSPGSRRARGGSLAPGPRRLSFSLLLSSGGGDSVWLPILDQPGFPLYLKPSQTFITKVAWINFCLKDLECFVFPIGHEWIKNAWDFYPI